MGSDVMLKYLENKDKEKLHKQLLEGGVYIPVHLLPKLSVGILGWLQHETTKVDSD